MDEITAIDVVLVMIEEERRIAKQDSFEPSRSASLFKLDQCRDILREFRRKL